MHSIRLELKINLTQVEVNLYQILFSNKALNQNSTTTHSQVVKTRVKVQDSPWVSLKTTLKVTLYSLWAAHLEMSGSPKDKLEIDFEKIQN